jgi:hypothetical protein
MCALRQRQHHHVAAVQVQQIEGAQSHRAASCVPAAATHSGLQALEVGAADLIQHACLSVDHVRPTRQFVEHLRKLGKPAGAVDAAFRAQFHRLPATGACHQRYASYFTS